MKKLFSFASMAIVFGATCMSWAGQEHPHRIQLKFLDHMQLGRHLTVADRRAISDRLYATVVGRLFSFRPTAQMEIEASVHDKPRNPGSASAQWIFRSRDALPRVEVILHSNKVKDQRIAIRTSQIFRDSAEGHGTRRFEIAYARNVRSDDKTYQWVGTVSFNTREDGTIHFRDHMQQVLPFPHFDVSPRSLSVEEFATLIGPNEGWEMPNLPLADTDALSQLVSSPTWTARPSNFSTTGFSALDHVFELAGLL